MRYAHFQLCLRSLVIVWLVAFYTDSTPAAVLWGLVFALDCALWAWEWADK